MYSSGAVELRPISSYVHTIISSYAHLIKGYFAHLGNAKMNAVRRVGTHVLRVVSYLVQTNIAAAVPGVAVAALEPPAKAYA